MRTAARLLVVLTLLAAFGGRGRSAELLAGDAARTKIDEVVAEFMKKPGAVGLSIAVAQGDEIILEKAYGLCDVELQVPARSETMFRIASMTKQFTAALIMKQVEAGKLRLDDPISKYCDFPTGKNSVSIRHLLTHTSGIKCYTGVGEKFDKNTRLEQTSESILNLVRSEPLEFTPGEKFNYSNTGYVLLGVILEKVSGKSFDELLSTEIVEPLHLARTRVDSTAEIIKNRAQGYAFENGVLSNAEFMGVSWTGATGQILSTAGDLVRWQRALASGKVVSQENYQQMISPFLLNKNETRYGFGLIIDETDGLPIVEHGGFINGFNSFMVAYPTKDLTVAVVSNCEAFDAESVVKAIARGLLRIVDVVADHPIPPAEITRLSGVYRPELSPIEISVQAKGEQLFIQMIGEPAERLLRQRKGVYRPVSHVEDRYQFAAGDPAPELAVVIGGVKLRALRKP